MKLNTFKNTSANTMVDIDDRVGRKRWFRRSGGLQLETPADTIDSIASKHLHGPVGFVNLTINGAELEAIEGMKDLMERYPDMHISIALKHSQDKHYKRRRPLVEVMIERGYNVCIADGQPRPWLEEPFFYAVATRMSEEELGKMGFERATREQVEQVLPAV